VVYFVGQGRVGSDEVGWGVWGGDRRSRGLWGRIGGGAGRGGAGRGGAGGRVKTHLGGIKDGPQPCGDAAAQQANLVQGSFLSDLRHTDLVNHCILCECGSPHLQDKLIRQADVYM
jgi:hypothetical protein